MRGIAVSSASRLDVGWSRMAQLRMLGCFIFLECRDSEVARVFPFGFQGIVPVFYKAQRLEQLCHFVEAHIFDVAVEDAVLAPADFATLFDWRIAGITVAVPLQIYFGWRESAA